MTINHAKFWSSCLAGISLAVGLSGCTSNTTSDYRVISQPTERTFPVDDARVPETTSPVDADPVADATRVENSLMMSIPAEIPPIPVIPISAMDIANRPKVELLVPNKTFATDRKTGALRLTFDDVNLLKVLNMDPVTDDAIALMPAWLTSLEGQQVRIRGYMNPPFSERDLERFILLRDNQECCYGPLAKVYDNIDVRMKAGTTTDYVLAASDAGCRRPVQD